MSFWKRVRRLLQKDARRRLGRRLAANRRRRGERAKYRKWIAARAADADAELLRRRAADFARRPLISVIVPVYNVEEKWLRLCLESVFNQIYDCWELCIADDCSPSAHIKRVLDEYAARDARVKVAFRAANGHISAASNSALALASGEFCALLDHDDELSADALFRVVEELNAHPTADFIYSDEDMIDEKGTRYQPRFKPDFSLDLLYSVNYVTHLAVYRTKILREIGSWRENFDGSQDYDLALRVIEKISADDIRHLPHILYHWRAIRGSVALASGEKPYAHERAREAIRAHLQRTGKNARVEPGSWNLHRVCYDLPAVEPLIGLIFYSAGDCDRRLIENITRKTAYERIETAAVARYDAEKLNAAAAASRGEIVVFIDVNLEPAHPDWLRELASFAAQPEIGAVGAKILADDGTTLHGGLIAGTAETISAAHLGFPADEGGNTERNLVIGNFSAISIACLGVKKKLFAELGGFDFRHLPRRFFDADFCLKLREKSCRIVFTPYAELVKSDGGKQLNFETDATAAEKEYFIERWREIVERDPFYNSNLSKKDGRFSIEI